jgi:hypothetical protein
VLLQYPALASGARSSWPQRTVAAVFIVSLFSFPSAARAASLGFVSGTVEVAGKPVGGAVVIATGNNLTLKTRTDPAGRFAFSTLPVGTYTISAFGEAGAAATTIDLSSGGATLTLALGALKTIGSTTTISAGGTLALRGSGTDLVLNQSLLARSPEGGSFPELLVQLPGAARGANGVVHLNGDHGDINYIVDGVSIPQELNRIVGAEFDPADAAYIEVLQGAYPAQYGNRFASVVNISTRSGQGPPGYAADFSGGSYAALDSTLGYHQPVGEGSLVVAFRANRSNWGLDPPEFGSPHNSASNSNEFIRLTVPRGNDFFNLTFSHSYATFQIPNDVSGGQPATTDDNEAQNDLFGTLQYHHAIGDHGVLTFSASYKQSTIQDFPDPRNDWTYGEAINVAPPPFGNGGTSVDCANAMSNPATFGPTTCGYALFSNRTAYDYPFNVDYALGSAAHEIHWGLAYDITLVPKHYDVALQPGNFLAPIYAPVAPNEPYAVIDNAPNTGHTESVYLQDSWRMGAAYQLDYGLRVDAFQLFSTDFQDGASMFSPRVKLTRFFGPRTSVYGYYGRFFTPFSFENVSPAAAYLLNLPLQRSIASFDLRPQRDSVYELGGHLPIGTGELGARIMQKNATDLIDDTQVGVTNLHQDINYQLGRIATQSLYYQLPLARGGRFYVTFNHTYSVNRGCETQLLAPCFGSPTDWTPADHQQIWGATSGFVMNDRRGGWLSLDGEYGSGLSSGACPPATPGACSLTPHVVFSVLKGIALRPTTVITAGIDNLLNDRFYVTLLNAQGNHFAAPRSFELGLRFAGR